MLDRIRKAKQEESGFTLIELLIVIIILGILAAIVVFAVGGITNRGTKAACKSDFKSVETAQEAKKAQDGVYGDSTTLVSGNFIKSYPAPGGTPPKYTINANTTGLDGKVTVTVGTTTGGITTCDSATD
ncbi:MAG: prepilin-type N-terminal cleavage/methylation domain-containing protein [Actinobacteria bacterium]|nr:prepilin-type N-terminal cleavage/methylation domain-containing protein [Actinomycetota bacterium]MCA1719581.1 prepilin-type N-terminal cleavage/methylation domain-containing protein [Actinomycetota bacterium]